MGDDRMDELEARVRWLERSVELLASVPGTPTLPDPPGSPDAEQTSDAAVRFGVTQEVIDHVLAGRTVRAVKAHRDATGAGLREAKRVIDDLAAELG